MFYQIIKKIRVIYLYYLQLDINIKFREDFININSMHYKEIFCTAKLRLHLNYKTLS